MDEYKSVYDRKRQGIDPLHVLPGMEYVPDLMPEMGKQSRETFAIGLARKFYKHEVPKES